METAFSFQHSATTQQHTAPPKNTPPCCLRVAQMLHSPELNTVLEHWEAYSQADREAFLIALGIKKN